MKFINPYYRDFGAFIPNWLLSRSEVSSGAKLCYARLVQYAGKNGSAWPKQDTLADELGIGVRNVQYLLKELIDLSLIHSTRQGKGLPSKYLFLDHEWMNTQYSAYEENSDTQNLAFGDTQDSAAPLLQEKLKGRGSEKKPSPKDLQDVKISDIMPWIEEKKKEGINFAGIDIAFHLEKCKNHFLGKKRTIGTAYNWILQEMKYEKERQSPAAQTSVKPGTPPASKNLVVGTPEWKERQRQLGLLP